MEKDYLELGLWGNKAIFGDFKRRKTKKWYLGIKESRNIRGFIICAMLLLKLRHSFGDNAGRCK